MRRLFAKHNLTKVDFGAVSRQSKRIIPSFYTYGTGNKDFIQKRYKRKVEDLKSFSESPIPSRAIRLIRNGISALDYAVQPKFDVEDSELESYQDSIDRVRLIFDQPNGEDDDFYTFLGQIIEDILVFDAGCWEYVERPDYIDFNEFLALEVVAGYTIQQNVHWNGQQDDVRWAQVVNNNIVAQFEDRQLEYLMGRKRSYTPWGLSHLETAMLIMESWLGLASYQSDIASNQYPPFLLYAGEETEPEQKDVLKTWWEQEVLGRGIPRWFGNTGRPEVLYLKEGGDKNLYLEYQDRLIRIMAFCFDLKPQDFGLERDVNRSTAEVSASQSVEEARKPIAELIQKKVNSRIIPKLADVFQDDRILDLEFGWIGINPRDLKSEAEILDKYAARDAIKLDDMRSAIDLDPLPNGIGQMTPTAFKEFAKQDMGQSLMDEAFLKGDEDSIVAAYRNPIFRKGRGHFSAKRIRLG